MATLISGLGGTAGYGENTFSTAGGRTGSLDDGSINVNLSSVFGAGGLNVYGTSYTSVFINTNGLLTFGSAEPAFTSAALTTLGQPSIAPFWTDIDISKGGEIYWDLDAATGKLTVTWLNVAAYTGPGTNSFQVVLTNLGAGDFSVEYIYDSIGFVNGGFGNATVGISNGTSIQNLAEGSGDASFLATYAGNDFDTQDPGGIWSSAFEGGQAFLGDGAVEGTAGSDLINGGYVGDPEGDRVDQLDGNGLGGTTGDADYVLAGAGDDTVAAGLANDIVYGGSGNDQITTDQGDDWADGGTEDDSLDGGSGNDSLYGGAGNDTLIGGSDSAAVNYTASYTEITTATQAVTGSSGRPNFTVRTTSNETLTAGSNGSVTGFRLGEGDATETHTHTATSQISGGQIRFNGINSNEALTITIDGVTMNLNTATANGTVTFNGASIYQINGAGQIVRVGSGSSSTTVGTLTINVPYTSVSLASTGSTSGGAAGLWYEYFVNTQPNNVAAGAGGDDLLYGGDGNDSAYGGNGNDTLHGDAGNDTLSGGVGNDLIYGGLDDDSLLGLDGADTLFGDGGNDTLDGGLDSDQFFGGAGADLLRGDAGNDTLNGDEGADTLYGGLGNDVLLGGAGGDALWGDDGDDTLNGGADSDLLYGGLGADSLLGDDGDDTLHGDEGTDVLFGGVGNDELFGGGESDTLNGGTGNDLLSGGAGSDQLVGDTGNDTLVGDLGSDTLTGGQGMDWADYSGSTSGVSVDLASGAVSGGYAQGDVLAGVDALLGSAYGDTLLGFDGFSTNPADPFTNVFFGDAGNDYLDGRGGDDSLYGGADDDTVLGGAGADFVDGGSGGDQLFGGTGDDTILGGDGGDVLDGGAGADSIDGGFGNDTIVVNSGTDPYDDTIAGGENDEDNDVLDLTAWGWALTNINYDLMNPENGTVEFLDANGVIIGRLTFSGIEKVIPCFTPGTNISTEMGETPVEALKPGDRVWTRDNGLQTIRWIGKRQLSLADLIVKPALRPIEITKGALGHDLPYRDMKVSPQHRMLIEGPRAEMLFGEAEVLVAATHLTALDGIEEKLTAGVMYIHVLFDQHEIICANGAWTESFQPAMRMVAGMDEAQHKEIAELFPELAGKEFDFSAARLSLKAHEARVLLSR